MKAVFVSDVPKDAHLALGLPGRENSVVEKTRTVAKAVNDVNAGKLSIAGYVPLPAIPPAWEGEAPDHEHTVRTLKESLKVATITNKGELLILRSEVVPVELTADIRKTLEEYRTQFPMPTPEPAAQQGPALAAGAEKFGSLKELKANVYVAKIIAQAALNFLIPQCVSEDMELWAHNPSTSRRSPSTAVPS